MRPSGTRENKQTNKYVVPYMFLWLFLVFS
jgi:hypothetical protein